MRELCIIDTETTGLDPAQHEIIDLAAVYLDPVKLDHRGIWSNKIMPRSLCVQEEASKINGFVIDNDGNPPLAWHSAPFMLEILPGFLEDVLYGRRIAGHNVSFDVAFLRSAWEIEGFVQRPRCLYSLYAHLDTATLAYPLYRRGIVEDLHLSTLAAHFGVVNEAPHTALGDALCTAGVLRALLRG